MQIFPRQRFFLPSVGVAGLIACWCFVTYAELVGPIFLPSPSLIGASYANLYEKGWLAPAIFRSFARVAMALLLVSSIGIPLGVLLAVSRIADGLTRHLIAAAKSVPVTGVLGLIILWFSIGEIAKVTFLFLGSIFYVIILVRSAVTQVNPTYVQVALDLGASRSQLVPKVLLPAALPRIFDAIIVANGLMWTYIVLAEFINSSQYDLGLGYLIYIGSRTQNSAMVYAALILIGLLSVGTDWLLGYFRRLLFRWSTPDDFD